MSFFKKCEHYYLPYNIYEGVFTLSCDFICVNCKKEIRINLESLEDELKNAKMEYKKKEILGETSPISMNINILHTSRSSYYVENYCGPYCVDIYKKYKKKGIDLTKLPTRKI